MRHRYFLVWAVALVAELPFSSAFSSARCDMGRQLKFDSSSFPMPTALDMIKGGGGYGMSPKGRRELEIRRKIMELKKEGKLKKEANEFEDDDEEEVLEEDMAMEKLMQTKGSMRGKAATDEYSNKIKAKLGKKKDQGEDDSDSVRESVPPRRRQAQLGSLSSSATEETDDSSPSYKRPSEVSSDENRPRIIDPSLFEDDKEDESEELVEDDLVELVAKKMEEKKQREAVERKQQTQAAIKAEQNEQEKKSSSLRSDDPVAKALQYKRNQDKAAESASMQTTTGIGGSWVKNETAAEADYRPSRGSWGYFPRPKDISKAYGGGRKIQADDRKIEESSEATRDRLRAYREKVGIEVQAEKDHAAEIEEALRIATYAMQRGVYTSAVSALEKVTKWCGSNSKVGGKVFLELAMAYEAVGRTEEAVAVYTTLSNCRIEEIKHNAKRLLYGIEAMHFMRNEVNNPNFSRKKIRNTFIDTTGLANIAENFDDRYETAYIDLDSGFYRKLTESVVRSNREARQILLKATGSGEVQRMKIVQALRSLSRTFDTALAEEKKRAAPAPEPVAVMNGKPILQKQEELSDLIDMDKFNLASPNQMLENIEGEWRLQLLADKKGDGVRYYNTTLSWQVVDTEAMRFRSVGSGFLSTSESGAFEFDQEDRVIERTQVSKSGAGGMFAAILSGTKGAAQSQSGPQQIVLVDSTMLVTRCAPPKTKKSVLDENVRDYFAVWRRVDPGTYSEKAGQP